MGEFSNDAGKALVKPTIDLTEKRLKQYKVIFTTLLNRISVIENEQESLLLQLKNIANTNERLSKLSSRDLAKELLKQKNKAKDDIIFQEAEKLLNKLEKSYIDSYKMINRFREEFFMPITYSYGFEYEGDIYSVSELTFNEISNLISIELASRTTELDNLYKLRLNATKANLTSFKNKHQDKLIKIQPREEKGSTLWSMLKRYQKKYTPPKVNKGQFYEIYRSILIEKKINNGPPAPLLDEEYILSKFIEVRANNLSWTKGGDVGTEQDKFMRASITSAKTLIKTMTEIINFLNVESINAEILSEKIAKIFSDNKFDTKVLNESEKYAKNIIQNEILMKLGPNTSFNLTT